MTYVFDTSAFSALFKNYYREQFPTLWSFFDELVESGNLLSTREAGRELSGFNNAALQSWYKDNKEIFHTPTPEEGLVVSKIYQVSHFQQNIERKKLYKGGLNADPFLIAKASVIDGTVVTVEKYKENATKIPNICKALDVECMSLEEFMRAEDWKF